jgi:hypothetical protein
MLEIPASASMGLLHKKAPVFSTSEHSPHHPLDTDPDVSRELSTAERSDKNLLEKMR